MTGLAHSPSVLSDHSSSSMLLLSLYVMYTTCSPVTYQLKVRTAGALFLIESELLGPIYAD